jgi:hypothetical protein
MVKSRERRGRVNTQPISSHLWGTEIRFRFKYRKNWGRGREVHIMKPSWSKCGVVNYYLSSGSPRVQDKFS